MNGQPGMPVQQPVYQPQIAPAHHPQVALVPPVPVGPIPQAQGPYVNYVGAPTVRHNTFAVLYGNATNDPLRQNYGLVIKCFDAMSNAPQPAETLLNIALGNPSVPNAYLCCASLHGFGNPKVYLLHAPSRYTPAMDGRIMP